MSEQPRTPFMLFYHTTAVKEWTCDNIVAYYRINTKSGRRMKKKLLDYIKKDIQKIANSTSKFSIEQKRKAQEILDYWKVCLFSNNAKTNA